MLAVLKSKKEIAKGTLSVVFQLTENIDFKPGQYFFIDLINPPYSDAKGNKRHFSFVNSPNEKLIIEMSTRLTDSAFKKSLNEMEIGEKVEIGGIDGRFLLPESKDQPIVFIAGGIGITPFISMLRYVKEEKLDYKITLLYSNRDKSSTAFFNELKELQNKIQNFKLVFSMTDDTNWKEEKRMIDGELIKNYISDFNKAIYMIAGPPPMVEAVGKTLKMLGVKKNNIIIENFFGY